MLNKIFFKVHGQVGIGKFYIESKNLNFDYNKVYDKNYNPIEIDKYLFDKAVQLIKRNILTGETQWELDYCDIALGTPELTPEHLL